MLTTEQQEWVKGLLGMRPRSDAADAAEGQAAPPETAAEEAAPPRVGTKGASIRIINGTGADLKLVASELQFPKTARFAPPPPPVVPGRDGTLHTDAYFNVVESTEGYRKSGGGAAYHIERRKTNSTFSFSWGGGKGVLKVDGPYYTSFHGETDTEAGDYYEFVLHESPGEEEKLEVRFDIWNKTGHDLTLVSATLDDLEHTEWELKPASKIPDQVIETSFVQPLDPDHADGAGTVTYRIEGADKPRTARMSWIKDGRPVGVMDPNDGAFVVESTGEGKAFRFAVVPHAGPPPATGGDSKVTVVNRSGYELTDMSTMLDGKSARFKSEPAQSVPDGGSTTFEVVSEDPHAPETDGYISYTFDFTNDQMQRKPTNAYMTWRTNGPPLAKIVPEGESDGFDVQVQQSGNDTTFTVTGPPLEFAPPAKVKQPTLRQGDKGSDGWVEYLQEALNHHLSLEREVTGTFGPDTYKDVIAFQTKHKAEGCMVDGVVGDQTWSFLREGVPEKPATDGRKPHSYVEQGQEARWVREKGVVRFDAARDALAMQLVSVGNVDDMEKRKVRVRVTAPDKAEKVVDRPIGPPVSASATGQGSTHEVLVTPFSTLFDQGATAAQPGDYLVESYFDEELGGDKFSETVTVPP